jgi:ABC-type Zn uptake system ZnuABC Zn-binding protein ZnuA
MKKFVLLFLILTTFLHGCATRQPQPQITATTLPVYEFTSLLCEGTGLTVTQLVTEAVSCLHDYSLNVRQVRDLEGAELVVISGAGLEDFMDDLLTEKAVIDSSEGIVLLEGGHAHNHGHEEDNHETHHHEEDPHIWLSPENAYPYEVTTLNWIGLVLVCFVLPAVLSFIFNEILRKIGLVKDGYMKLDT